MLTQDEIINEYANLGKSELQLSDTLKMKDARTKLIGAARFYGCRVAVKRDPDRNVAVATVLNTEEAAAQARRAAIYRGVNFIRLAVEVFDTELDDQGKNTISDIVADLEDIVNELEAKGGAE